MSQLLSANILEVFGLDWKSMLFYVVNFLILLAAMIGLLYKPVKNMLKKKRESLDEVYLENEKLKAESEKNSAEYEKKMEELKLESARAAATAAVTAALHGAGLPVHDLLSLQLLVVHGQALFCNGHIR